VDRRGGEPSPTQSITEEMLRDGVAKTMADRDKAFRKSLDRVSKE